MMLLGRVVQGFGAAVPRTLFAHGLTFGNFNAMSLQPFGPVVGSAAAVRATVMPLVNLIVAAIIGNLFQGPLLPVMLGYLVTGALALGLLNLRQGGVVFCDSKGSPTTLASLQT